MVGMELSPQPWDGANMQVARTGARRRSRAPMDWLLQGGADEAADLGHQVDLALDNLTVEEKPGRDHEADLGGEGGAVELRDLEHGRHVRGVEGRGRLDAEDGGGLVEGEGQLVRAPHVLHGLQKLLHQRRRPLIPPPQLVVHGLELAVAEHVERFVVQPGLAARRVDGVAGAQEGQRLVFVPGGGHGGLRHAVALGAEVAQHQAVHPGLHGVLEVPGFGEGGVRQQARHQAAHHVVVFGARVRVFGRESRLAVFGK